MRKKLFAALLLLSGISSAQDFHLSQYDAAPLNLNAGMTGMFSGWYRMHLHYRQQWTAIANNPFITTGVSFDMPIKKWAVGGQILDYRAGTGNYNVFEFLASGSYDYAIDKFAYHHLSSGLQLGLIQKSVNFDKLTWDNQYITSGGGQFDTSIPSNEELGKGSYIIPDVNAGVMYYYGKNTYRVNPFIGLSAFHLTQPNESFYGETNKLPLRYIVHAGCKININEKFQLLPKVFEMHQLNAREFTGTIHAHYYLSNNDAYLIAGPTFRLSGPMFKKNQTELGGYKAEKDAMVAEFGLKYGKFLYRFSYDINMSTLKPATNGRGGFELSVTYIAKRQKPNPISNCPRL